MNYEIKQLDKFKFIEEGEGEPLLLLHGLFGALSNFTDLVEYFRRSYTVVVPLLPLFDLDIFQIILVNTPEVNVLHCRRRLLRQVLFVKVCVFFFFIARC